MSYAYLFKYIIIGDTGILLLLLLSSRVYVCMCVRGFGVCVCVMFFLEPEFFFLWFCLNHTLCSNLVMDELEPFLPSGKCNSHFGFRVLMGLGFRVYLGMP
jgi:hypothetical protein